jgi:hypothetical protein
MRSSLTLTLFIAHVSRSHCYRVPGALYLICHLGSVNEVNATRDLASSGSNVLSW